LILTRIPLAYELFFFMAVKGLNMHRSQGVANTTSSCAMRWRESSAWERTICCSHQSATQNRCRDTLDRQLAMTSRTLQLISAR